MPKKSTKKSAPRKAASSRPALLAPFDPRQQLDVSDACAFLACGAAAAAVLTALFLEPLVPASEVAGLVMMLTTIAACYLAGSTGLRFWFGGRTGRDLFWFSVALIVTSLTGIVMPFVFPPNSLAQGLFMAGLVALLAFAGRTGLKVAGSAWRARC